MGKSSRVLDRDRREVYLLLGECCGAGRDPGQWTRRLHEGLGRIMGVHQSVWIEGAWEAVTGVRGPNSDERTVAQGFEGARMAQMYEEFLAVGAARQDACARPWQGLKGGFVTRAREQLASDGEWYGSENYNEYYRVCGIEHMVLSRCPVGGRHLLLQVWRRLGDRPFGPRETELVRLVQLETHRLIRQGRLASLSEPLAGQLPERLGQVLELLGRGKSEKEAAGVLGLSVHTVHDHVKRLYRRFGVSSRGELLAAYYGKGGWKVEAWVRERGGDGGRGLR